MSEQPQGPDWWQASDGRWYPPSATAEPPAPGWWLASDGQWYPPREEPPVAGWWLASDGRWYPPAETETVERPLLASTSSGPVAAPAPPAGSPVRLAGKPSTLTAPAPERPVAATTERPDRRRTAAPRRERPSRAGRASLLAPRTPQEQIARRDDASRQDAKVVAAARARAATGALATLRAQIAAETAAAAAATPDPAPTAAPDRAEATLDAGEAATLVRSPETIPGAGRPLLEVRPSPVAADIERLGERLAVYEDRVAMLDRHDNVRDRIDGHEIADVVLTKRFTGWTVTIESGAGASIVVKGLRQEHAEEVRDLIMGRTRRAGPVPSRGRRGAAPAPAPAPAPAAAGHERTNPSEVTDLTDAATPVDTVHLLAMLDELHQARVLDDDELAAKRRLVESMVGRAPLTHAP